MIEKSELQEEFENLKSELKIFETLKVGDKISRDSATNILYIDPPSTFQSLWRWGYSENRLKTVSHLDESFKNYQSGIFGEDMNIEIVNEGPVTFLFEN